MAGIQGQRLDIIGDGVLRLPALDQRIAEVAPARDQMRRQPQRGFVVSRPRLRDRQRSCRRCRDSNAFRYGVDGGQPGCLTFDRSEAALKRLDRLADPAGV